jgi:hypothetical protein
MDCLGNKPGEHSRDGRFILTGSLLGKSFDMVPLRVGQAVSFSVSEAAFDYRDPTQDYDN